MHPDSAEVDDVCGDAEFNSCRQSGKPIIKPLDGKPAVPSLALRTHPGRRLDRKDLKTPCGEPSRVASGTGAEIDHQSRRVWQDARTPFEDVRSVDTLIPLRLRRSVLVVPAYSWIGWHCGGSSGRPDLQRRLVTLRRKSTCHQCNARIYCG